jgi:hypothetical protein
MNGKKIQRIIIFFSVINVLLLGLYGVLYFSIKEKNQKTTEIYSSLYKKASEKEILLSIEKSLASTVDKRKIMETYFVKPAEAVSFIEQIEDLGDYARVEIKLNSVTPPKKKGEVFFLDFSAKGGFENMYRLFSLIDEMPYRVSIKKATLAAQAPEKNDSAAEWNGSFTVMLESYTDS